MRPPPATETTAFSSSFWGKTLLYYCPRTGITPSWSECGVWYDVSDKITKLITEWLFRTCIKVQELRQGLARKERLTLVTKGF